MTTPTDPTTLRTALEALVQKWSDEAISAMSNGLTEQAVATEWCASDLRAVLATPAPAADEARCAFVGCGGVRDDVFHEPCLPGGAFHDHKACHPFQPAPTPAPAADEARCAFPDCNGRRGNILHNPGVGDTLDDHPFQPAPTPAPPTPRKRPLAEIADDLIGRMPPPTPPATEPVAALVEKLMWTLNALVDETWEQDDVDEVSRYLDAIVAAARAEVDVERLARSMVSVLVHREVYTADGATSIEKAAARIAAAYRETADDR